MNRLRTTCETCEEPAGHPQGTVTLEARGSAPPVQIAWTCSKGHKNVCPPRPRTPLHQGAVYLDEVAGILETSEDEVQEAVGDGLLVTDFGGKGVWLGDLMRWASIRKALAGCAAERRPELKPMLIERFAAQT